MASVCCVLCVCVCVLRCDREEGGGVWGLSRKAIKPFKSHKVLGQSKRPPCWAPHVLHCVYVCECEKKSDRVHASACFCAWGEEVCASMCVNVCISVSFVCAEVVSEPVWRVSGILGTKRERKGGKKEGMRHQWSSEKIATERMQRLDRNVSGSISMCLCL